MFKHAKKLFILLILFDWYYYVFFERIVSFHSIIFICARDHKNNTHVNGREERSSKLGGLMHFTHASRVLSLWARAREVSRN